jgi:hypothetical protein
MLIISIHMRRRRRRRKILVECHCWPPAVERIREEKHASRQSLIILYTVQLWEKVYVTKHTLKVNEGVVKNGKRINWFVNSPAVYGDIIECDLWVWHIKIKKISSFFFSPDCLSVYAKWSSRLSEWKQRI